MIVGLIALIASTAAPVPVATPAPAVTMPRAPAAGARGAAAMKALGMSDAGIAVLRHQSAPDPDARALLAKRQALRATLAEAAAATPFDVDAFAALLRESSALEQSVRARSEERIVTTLKALPAADRPIFAKAVFAMPAGAAPATPAAPRVTP